MTAKKTVPDEVWEALPVAHTTYRVEFHHKLRSGFPSKKGRRKRVLGECNFDTKTITIDTYQSADAQRLALLHEWIHAWADACGYDDWGANEAKVEALAQGMAKLIDWLKSEEKL